MAGLAEIVHRVVPHCDIREADNVDSPAESPAGRGVAVCQRPDLIVLNQHRPVGVPDMHSEEAVFCDAVVDAIATDRDPIARIAMQAAEVASLVAPDIHLGDNVVLENEVVGENGLAADYLIAGLVSGVHSVACEQAIAHSDVVRVQRGVAVVQLDAVQEDMISLLQKQTSASCIPITSCS